MKNQVMWRTGAREELGISHRTSKLLSSALESHNDTSHSLVALCAWLKMQISGKRIQSALGNDLTLVIRKKNLWLEAQEKNMSEEVLVSKEGEVKSDIRANLISCFSPSSTLTPLQFLSACYQSLVPSNSCLYFAQFMVAVCGRI